MVSRKLVYVHYSGADVNNTVQSRTMQFIISWIFWQAIASCRLLVFIACRSTRLRHLAQNSTITTVYGQTQSFALTTPADRGPNAWRRCYGTSPRVHGNKSRYSTPERQQGLPLQLASGVRESGSTENADHETSNYRNAYKSLIISFPLLQFNISQVEVWKINVNCMLRVHAQYIGPGAGSGA